MRNVVITVDSGAEKFSVLLLFAAPASDPDIDIS